MLQVYDIGSASCDDSSDDFITPSSDDSDSDEGLLPNKVDYVERALRLTMDPIKLGADQAKKRKQRTPRGGWTKRAKLPYESSMFYRDFHNENVKDLNHIDAKEFRLNYRMPWTEANKLVNTI